MGYTVNSLISKYVWLIRIITNCGDKGISLAELQCKWENTFDCSYPRRTFNNHREQIASIFGIEIECNKSTNRYFIQNAENAIDQDSSVGWLVNTFTVNNLLTLGKERLSGRVSVEDIPSGQKYLTQIMHSMLENKVLLINYKKYTDTDMETLHIHPYAVKEHSKRWYLIGYCRERGEIRVYGLDRILSMNESEEVFNLPEGFDVDELFSDSFGIYLHGNQKPVVIKFKTDEKDAMYLRDLPIHASQVEIAKDSDGVTFRIKVIPNVNLIMEFCKLGRRVRILEPQEIADAVHEEHKSASKLYE